MPIVKQLLPNNKKNIAISTILIVLYYISIHPMSGALGGLILMLTFGTIPTIINILISATASNIIKCKLNTRFIIFIIISVCLGINTNFLYLFKMLLSPSYKCKYEINKNVNIIQNGYFYTKLSSNIESNIFIPNNGMMSSITVGGDAGCGCLYFNENKSYTKNILRNISPNGNISQISQSSDTSGYINISLIKDGSSIIYRISVVENNIETAWFEMNKVPYKIISNNYGRDKGLLNGDFIENVTDMLLHNNIWSLAIGSFLPFSKISDINQMKNFINESAKNKQNT